MLNRLKKNKSEGFTIIEVMIVLAIAGLIILIVLLAVPALQRNSRNTAIKNDASAVTAAISEFGSNNEGKIPTTANSSQSGSTVTVGGPTGTTEATAKVQGSTVVRFSGTDPTATEFGVIVVQYGQKCTTGSSFTTNGNTRSTAILYNIETSSASAPQCVDG